MSVPCRLKPYLSKPSFVRPEKEKWIHDHTFSDDIDNIFGAILAIMHQSFVSMAPPLTVIGGDNDF